MTVNPYDYFEAAPVNNAGLDPIAGFDVEVWVQDSVTGQVAIFGRFQTITFSVRDATETYLELGMRIPTYLNGEIQIAWVLEQGLVDMNFLNRTFGVSAMARSGFLSRGPRFHITFDVDAWQLQAATASNMVPNEYGEFPTQSSNASSSSTSINNTSLLTSGGAAYAPKSSNSTRSTAGFEKQRRTVGRIELTRCKVDSVSMGAMAGRRVAAVRWEGVAEGWNTLASSVQGNNFALQNGITHAVDSTSLTNANNLNNLNDASLGVSSIGNVAGQSTTGSYVII